ncbi:hypothetical protein CHS0354_005983 [Potamilus streckersoni]|uniref:Uncharacterized protein n=1 Tax=Potamilus streckersoni TaxID=2493646 RepID=A0AAE0RP14_9BIVA|nr:hypothetical protein CHS0354_005983 [Potamilus streckersoni]
MFPAFTLPISTPIYVTQGDDKVTEEEEDVMCIMTGTNMSLDQNINMEVSGNIIHEEEEEIIKFKKDKTILKNKKRRRIYTAFNPS